MTKDHVPTIETCKRLMKAGFPQRTEFGWTKKTDCLDLSVIYGYDSTKGLPIEEQVIPLSSYWEIEEYGFQYAAPLLTEIMEKLPKRLGEKELGMLYLWRGECEFHYFRWVGKERRISHLHFDHNPAEAAALLYLSLQEAHGPH